MSDASGQPDHLCPACGAAMVMEPITVEGLSTPIDYRPIRCPNRCPLDESGQPIR